MNYGQASGMAAADHVVEARRRAREVLGGEAHIGDVDDWRRVLVSARDAVILIWLTWVALHGLGDPPLTGLMLVTMAVGVALLVGMSTARSTDTQVQYYASELDRERKEIREHFDEECEEIRALYAAKGFREPLLSDIVATLSADDDRLLKVMMEEELGLSMQHVHHPLIVGLWNFAGAAAAGLALAIPSSILSGRFVHWWMPLGSAGLLLLVSLLAAWATRRSPIEFFTVSVVMGAVTGGVVYFLAQWLVLIAAAA